MLKIGGNPLNKFNIDFRQLRSLRAISVQEMFIRIQNKTISYLNQHFSKNKGTIKLRIMWLIMNSLLLIITRPPSCLFFKNKIKYHKNFEEKDKSYDNMVMAQDHAEMEIWKSPNVSESRRKTSVMLNCETQMTITKFLNDNC